MHAVPSLDDLQWPVRTERLLLRRATVDDALSVHRVRSAPGVSDWLPDTPASETEEEWLDRFRLPERLARTLVVEHDGALVGDLYLAVGDAWAQRQVADRAAQVQAEIGWALHPSYAGRGLATEAARELLRICFNGLGLRRVVAQSFADNVASVRVMERIGMRRETHAVRDSLHRSGRWLDGVGYAIVADEWTAVQRTPRRADPT